MPDLANLVSRAKGGLCTCEICMNLAESNLPPSRPSPGAEEGKRVAIKIQVERDDSIAEGFAAYLAPSLTKDGEGIVLLNIEAQFDVAVNNDIDPKELLTETIMHEVGHALEEFFALEFNEDRMERLVESYRQKYPRPVPKSEPGIGDVTDGTIWDAFAKWHDEGAGRDCPHRHWEEMAWYQAVEWLRSRTQGKGK